MWQRKYEERTEPRKVLVEEKLLCDWCGTEIVERQYEVSEGRVLLRAGSNYPDGGNIRKWIADVCETCFKGKLIPLLLDNGCAVREEESDW